MSDTAQTKPTFDTSLKNGNHHFLSQLTGEWEGTTRTWFEPDLLADESPMTGTIKSILGGRFIMHEYKGSLMGKPLEGIAIYGYQMREGKFKCAWIDSFHMGTDMMLSEGGKSKNGFSLMGNYGVAESEPWGWRTEIGTMGNDSLVITAYNVSPEGEEAKATETVYSRKK